MRGTAFLENFRQSFEHVGFFKFFLLKRIYTLVKSRQFQIIVLHEPQMMVSVRFSENGRRDMDLVDFVSSVLGLKIQIRYF